MAPCRAPRARFPPRRVFGADLLEATRPPQLARDASRARDDEGGGEAQRERVAPPLGVPRDAVPSCRSAPGRTARPPGWRDVARAGRLAALQGRATISRLAEEPDATSNCHQPSAPRRTHDPDDLLFDDEEHVRGES